MRVQTALCCLQLARKDGATPLHEAAAAGHTKVAKVLMSVGATPDVTDVVSRPQQVMHCLLCVQQSMLSVSSLIQAGLYDQGHELLCCAEQKKHTQLP